MTVATQVKEALERVLAMEALERDLARDDIGAARVRAREERRRALASAPGVPITQAAELLGVSEPTVRRLRDAGWLGVQPDYTRRLALESVLALRGRLEELRAAGRQRGFLEALAQEVADKRLVADPAIASGLAALRRGEYTIVED